MSGIDPAKIAAYQDTDYVVRVRQGQFVLRIGQVSPELQALYAETGQGSAVFITAFNPEGALQADALNQAAHEALRNALSALTDRLFEGEGRGTQDNAAWPGCQDRFYRGARTRAGSFGRRRLHTQGSPGNVVHLCHAVCA